MPVFVAPRPRSRRSRPTAGGAASPQGTAVRISIVGIGSRNVRVSAGGYVVGALRFHSSAAPAAQRSPRVRQWPHVHPGRQRRAARGPLEPAAQPPPAPQRATRGGPRRPDDAGASRRPPRSRRPTATAAKPKATATEGQAGDRSRASAGARRPGAPKARADEDLRDPARRLRDAPRGQRPRQRRSRRRARRAGAGHPRAAAVLGSAPALAGRVDRSRLRRSRVLPAGRSCSLPALPNSRASMRAGDGGPTADRTSAGANRDSIA